MTRADVEPDKFQGASKQTQTQQQLRLLLAAVEQSASTVVITDTRGYIEYANPKFMETTGYTLKEAIGQHTRILRSGRTTPEAYKQLLTHLLKAFDYVLQASSGTANFIIGRRMGNCTGSRQRFPQSKMRLARSPIFWRSKKRLLSVRLHKMHWQNGLGNWKRRPRSASLLLPL